MDINIYLCIIKQQQYGKNTSCSNNWGICIIFGNRGNVLPNKKSKKVLLTI